MKYSKLGSLIATVFIVAAAVVIPSVTLIQNVEAATSKKLSAFSIGDTDVFKSVLVEETKETEPEVEGTEAVEVEEEVEEEAYVEDEAEEEYEEYEEDYSEGYSAAHIELSDYDRTLLEGLVMGEAGTLGFEGAALVAQAVRDSMVLSGTTSVEEIIYSYQYDASPYNDASDEVCEAVSFIFDQDGSAVDHRILYFYAADIVDDAWHETQQFVTQCGNVRFFDQW